MALAVPVGMVMPSLFWSCRKQPLFQTDWKGKVIVVGAGASGLYAAYLLHQAGIEVQILEASDKSGGRVRPLEGFTDFPVELGAEIVHGQRSIWHDIVRDHGGTFVQDHTEDFMSLDGVLTSEDDAENDADVEAAMNFLETLESWEGADITVEQAATEAGLSARVMYLIEAMAGTELGTSNSRVGAVGLAREADLWSAGEQNLTLKGQSFLQIMHTAFSSIMDKILYDVPVSKITQVDSSTERMRVDTSNGQSFDADRVIVTASLGVLQAGLIEFEPVLPSAKQSAIDGLGMGKGMKIILKFNQRFWPANLGSLLDDGPVIEFWSTGTGRSEENNTLTCFIMGEEAEFLAAQGAGAVPLILEQLDGLYGAGVASNNLADSVIMDWTAEPYILGSYSYPPPNSAGLRQALAEPVADKLYFAGEAANTVGHPSSVHGAMEAASAAVRLLIENVNE